MRQTYVTDFYLITDGNKATVSRLFFKTFTMDKIHLKQKNPIVFGNSKLLKVKPANHEFYRKIAVLFIMALSIQAYSQKKSCHEDTTGLITESRFLPIVKQKIITTSNSKALSDFTKSMNEDSLLCSAQSITAITERYNEDFQDCVLNLIVTIVYDSTTIEKYCFSGVDKFLVECFYCSLEKRNKMISKK